MKYCGCERCRRNGEVNPHETFEKYLETRSSQFEEIFKASYTVGEMEDLYDKYESSFLDQEKPVIVRHNHLYGYGNLIHYWLMGGGI